jgi:small-conductance mechanosensitive channel
MSFLAAVKIGDSVQKGLDTFFAFVPRLVGFLLILLIGYIVAKVVKSVLTKVLERVGLDHALHTGSTGQYVNKVAPDTKPSRTIGAIAFWFIFLGAISIAVSQLGIRALTDFVASIAAYLPNVVAAIIIFVIAGVIAAAVGGLVARTMGDTPTGKIVGSVVPVLVMAIATFMILNQLKIAPAIVTITYAALIGGVFLAMALAFGLGGRSVAQRMLEDAYDKGQDKKDQVKDDMETGKDRAQRDAQQAKDKAQEKTGAGNGGVQPVSTGGSSGGRVVAPAGESTQVRPSDRRL